MHEMALIENVVEIVLKQAKLAEAEKVVCVRLRIGEIRDVVDDLLEKCFRFLARGTIASEARLELTKVPLVVRCEDCGHEAREHILNYASMCCEACGSRRLSMVSGTEFLIEDIEIM